MFTYHIITEGEGIFKMLMHDYGGGVGGGEGAGLVMTWANKFFLDISGFSLIYVNVNNC